MKMLQNLFQKITGFFSRNNQSKDELENDQYIYGLNDVESSESLENNMKIGTLDDGSKVLIRQRSKKGTYCDGGPTMEIVKPDDKKKIRIRYAKE